MKGKKWHISEKSLRYCCKNSVTNEKFCKPIAAFISTRDRWKSVLAGATQQSINEMGKKIVE